MKKYLKWLFTRKYLYIIAFLELLYVILVYDYKYNDISLIFGYALYLIITAIVISIVRFLIISFKKLLNYKNARK